MANLGYAEGRWLAPVWPGDTLRSQSEVIGLKETTSGATGVVWVRTTGLNQHGDVGAGLCALGDGEEAPPRGGGAETHVPVLARSVDPATLVVPEGLDFARYDFALAGEPHRWGDYAVGEVIDHVDARDGGRGRAYAGHAAVAEHVEGAFRRHASARMGGG